MKALVLSGGASHGAFQAGVLRGLDEMGWKPDFVLGTSVGAINGVAYASGMGGERLCGLWEKINSKSIFRKRPLREWPKILTWNYVLETAPLRKLLEKTLDIEAAISSPITTLVTSIDVRTGRQCVFSSKGGSAVDPLLGYYKIHELDIDSVMASSAIPGVFPAIKGHWDGAFLQHNPLKPAILMGASEILVVHQTVSEGGESSLPKGIVQVALRIVEMASTYHVVKDLELLRERNSNPYYRPIATKVIHPTKPLGYSKLNFDNLEKKLEAMEAGYKQTLNAFGKERI